ncbi:unnamed protein product [Prunus brigantina]
MYPVTFAVVEQKGLGQAIRDLIPTPEHRHCVRHLHNNFKIAGHSGLALKQRLWAVARSTTIPTFEAKMEKIPTSHWSRSHFTTHSKCDMLLKNLSRDKTILTLLERIRSYLKLRMARLRETVWTHDVGPRIFGIIENLTTESAQCMASYAGGGKYQVNNIHGGMYVVDLDRHTCTCRKWDLCGIPYSYVMAAIAKREKSPYDFVHSLYKSAAYDKAYESYISPMPNQEYWRKIGHRSIKSSLYHKQPKRHRTSRQKEPNEIPKMQQS